MPHTRAREIVGFAGSGLIFETENRFLDKKLKNPSIKPCISQDFAIHRLTGWFASNMFGNPNTVIFVTRLKFDLRVIG